MSPTRSEQDGYAVQRIADVHYSRPPIARAWSHSHQNEQIFVMNWPGDPRTAKTLAEMGKQLREALAASGKPLLSSGDPRVREFDGAIDLFLKLQEGLHKNNWTLGLVHPGNLVYLDSPSDPQIVPVDLGFHWDGDIAKPAWIAEHPGREYWDETAEVRQAAWGVPQLAPEAFAVDVKVAARIIAGSVLGSFDPRKFTDLPFYDVIRQALNGGYATSSELRKALSSAPASQPFCQTPRPAIPLKTHSLAPEASGGSSSKWVALLLLVVAGGAGGAWYFTRNSTDNRDEKGAQAKSANGDNRSTEPEAKKIIDDAKKILVQATAKPPKDRGADLKAIHECLKGQYGDGVKEIKADADKIRAAYFDDWIARFEDAQRSDLTRNRNAAILHIEELLNEFKAFMVEYPPFDPGMKAMEKQCYDYASEFLLQLRPH